MRDPLLHLTLLGLVLAGVLAMLNPHEAYDAEDPHRQVGRNVAVRLEVLTAEHGDGWSRGIAIPVGTHANSATTAATGRIDGAASWVWFRPGETPHPGDRIDGTARVQADGNAIELLLSGPDAARLRPGPHPIAAKWAEIIERPGDYADRVVRLVAYHEDGLLRSPDGTHHCPLDGRPHHISAEIWTIRLTLDPTRPGWRCALEGI